MRAIAPTWSSSSTASTPPATSCSEPTARAQASTAEQEDEYQQLVDGWSLRPYLAGSTGATFISRGNEIG